MAEYDGSRLYWIKLTDHFMTSDTVDYLMSQPDGANYVVLYQMLCLKTINNNGVLARRLGEIIVPYDIDKIQRDCKYFTIDTVRIALTLYKNLGLIYEQEDGLFRISGFERLIGSQTKGAEKKQIQREKSAQKLPENASGQSGGQKVDICPPDIDIDKVLNNNINTTHTCARAREEVSVTDFEAALDCIGWEKYPNGEVYVEIRDTLIELINSGQIELSDLTHEIIGEMLNSMFAGRERREIVNLRAYLLTIVMRQRKSEGKNNEVL